MHEVYGSSLEGAPFNWIATGAWAFGRYLTSPSRSALATASEREWTCSFS